MYAWIDCGDGRQVYRKIAEPTAKRSSLPVPMFIRDDMPATEHVDGIFYTSKAAYRRVTKERGYVEIGDDPARLRSKTYSKPKPNTKANREALKQAAYMVRNGIKP